MPRAADPKGLGACCCLLSPLHRRRGCRSLWACRAACWRARHPLVAMGNSSPAMLRIKALWRLQCCALPVFGAGGAGAPGQRERRGPPFLSAPGFSQVAEAQRLKSSATLVDGNSSPPCCASSGVCIVASYISCLRIRGGPARARENIDRDLFHIASRTLVMGAKSPIPR